MSLGDFNADGFNDLYIGGGSESPPLTAGVYYGGPHMDAKVDLHIWGSFYLGVSPSCADLAGDVNHDGYNDLITGYFDGGYWGKLSIFLGGPAPDSFPDVTIENEDLPGGSDGFALFVAGIGDFTGDGIDDFAAYGPVYGYGRTNEVHIFAGWEKTATGVVGDRNGKTPPPAFELAQNYPNPFNPVTTISYSVPRRAQVTIDVFDILGQKVRTLVVGNKAAGSYQVEWDGTDNAGRAVATGIYLYRYQAGDVVQTKKMLLLK